MKLSVFFILYILGGTVSAQQFKRILLFDGFVQAQIKFHSRSVLVVPFNYDASNKTVLYRQGTEMMEMINFSQIDTVIAGKRKFVPADRGIREVVEMKNGTVYIDWLLKDVNIGSKGALGAVTQGTVKNLQMSDLGLNGTEMYTPYDSQKIGSTDVYRRRNDNTYYIKVRGRLEKVKSLKHLKKIFAGHEDEIDEFAKEQNIDMKKVQDVLVLLDYCLGLSSEGHVIGIWK